MTKQQKKETIAEKMSTSSDQKVSRPSDKKPAMGKNIKQMNEDVLKEEVAKKMARDS